MTRIYKLLSKPEWERALAAGVFHGSDADRRDGFIHFSTAAQLQDTARRHFPGRADLVVVEVEDHTLGAALKWEVSSRGACYPHLFAPLQVASVLSARSFVAEPTDVLQGPGDFA